MSKALIFVALILLILGAAVWASDVEVEKDEEATDISSTPSDVIVLNKKNFNDIINKDIALVEFYAPWCGHCKSLAPIYEQVATALKAEGITVAKIDASKKSNAKFNEQYGIEGFPTLVIFKKGKIFKIQPDRTADAIIATTKRFLGSAVKSLASEEDLTKFTEAEYVIVGFFDKEADAKAHTAFSEAADSLRSDYAFAEVLDKAVAEKLGVKAPAVVAFRKFDEPKVTFSGEFVAADIEKFVAQNSLPVVGEVTQATYPKYAARGLPWAWLFVDQEDAAALAANVASLKEATKGIESKFNFVYLDGKKYVQMAKQYGLSGEKIPALAIEAEGKHYILEEDQEVNAANIRKTLDSFIAGTLARKIRSQPIPESNEGPVKVIVANNFDSVVLDDTKDVLLEFYAPWCGHCQKLTPIYESLGQEFAKIPSVVIAKMDATENDVDAKYNVEGFPTLLLFPAGKKDSPIAFNDKRELETLSKFVRDNAGVKIVDSTKDEL